MPSARDTVHEALHRRLMDGFYDRDSSLVPQALSEEFEVSRTPVREALGLLEQAGLLVATSRGFVVRERSDEEMLEIFEVRAILESSATAAAARRRNPIDLARLRDVTAHSGAAGDPAQVRRAFNLFHDHIRVAAHNETISTLLRTLSAQIKVAAPWRVSPSDDGLAASQAEHEAILAAIEAGDSVGAEQAMLDHLAHDRDNRISQFVAEHDPARR
ncbi:GntR family transcriptional regulator [Nocardioides sp.]|uniref:GntR family transcriptional regulator n=1 Tax=Nocardioides sp. TaxID=35761 RepID=UPI00262E8066|nr:GntR family transcriptional regulator [Nocardioides sp.]